MPRTYSELALDQLACGDLKSRVAKVDEDDSTRLLGLGGQIGLVDAIRQGN